jgi:hypothetical protein
MAGLREFVTELLESEGAVVEPLDADGLEVLVPDALRESWGWPELVRLGFGANAAADMVPIGLEGDWLDRFAARLGERGRFAERQLKLPDVVAAPGDPQRLIDRAVPLPNAVWRLAGVDHAWSRCLVMAFRYTAISDEKREGLVSFGFNCTTGAVLDAELVAALRQALARQDDWPAPDAEASRAAGALGDHSSIAARAGRLAARLVHADLDPFLAAMRRRLDRDRRRVHQYHDDLRRAALLKLAALERTSDAKPDDRAAQAIARERMRVTAVEREYAAKLDDLRHHYALAVKVEFVQALSVLVPVQRHTLLVKRRKGERRVAVDWHAAARRMEPALCEWGEGLARARYVCDDRLHLTDESGQSPCPACGRSFCRACHPAACPKCGAPVPSASESQSRGGTAS